MKNLATRSAYDSRCCCCVQFSDGQQRPTDANTTEIMYSRADIPAFSAPSIEIDSRHATSEPSSEIVSPTSDIFQDNPAPIPEPALPEDFQEDELDYERTLADDDYMPEESKAGYGGEVDPAYFKETDRSEEYYYQQPNENMVDLSSDLDTTYRTADQSLDASGAYLDLSTNEKEPEVELVEGDSPEDSAEGNEDDGPSRYGESEGHDFDYNDTVDREQSYQDEESSVDAPNYTPQMESSVDGFVAEPHPKVSVEDMESAVVAPSADDLGNNITIDLDQDAIYGQPDADVDGNNFNLNQSEASEEPCAPFELTVQLGDEDFVDHREESIVMVPATLHARPASTSNSAFGIGLVAFKPTQQVPQEEEDQDVSGDAKVGAASAFPQHVEHDDSGTEFFFF